MRFKLSGHHLTGHPATLVIVSFALADLMGTLLLVLPFMHQGPLSLLDAFFTATSAVCVTGLTVVNTAETFTRAGQTVILALIQLGGLGVMTFSILIALGFKKGLGLKSRLVIQEAFLPYGPADLRDLLRTIFLYTFLVEGLISIFLLVCFLLRFPPQEALFHAVFHAVSAFCNAGFSTFPEGLVSYQHGFLVPSLIMCAVFLGNTGFPVAYELNSRLRRRQRRFSLHFKLTLFTHFFLLFLGALVLLASEWDSAFADFPLWLKFLSALFHSVSARTAGFNTVDMARFSEHGLYFITLLMFIGACPGSTGGGIKTTTAAVIWAAALSRLRGYFRTIAFKRTIPELQVGKAMTLLVTAVTTVVIIHFLLTYAVPSFPFYQAQGEFLATLFEVVSAMGTVGLSIGITPSLHPLGKLLIIVAMFLGRVGLLSLLSVLSQVQRPKPYFYAQEEVMVG